MNWNKTVDIKPILEKDQDTDESARLVAKELANFLSKELHGYCTGNSNLDYIIKDLKRAKTQCKINNILARLYDWADWAKVWLG